MGNSPYVDYEVSSSKTWAAEEQLRYLPGMGTQADLAVESGTPGEPMYYHGDLIGSTMMLTDGVGQTVNTAAYTAFGEYVVPGSSGTIGGDLPSDFSRYGYAGAHGYESGLMTLQGANTDLPPITLQHLGERWYQPGLGRFVQRDPIGINGGLNVYLYCVNNPLAAVDPSGLWSPIRWIYTGDGNASNSTYDAALDGVVDYWTNGTPPASSKATAFAGGVALGAAAKRARAGKLIGGCISGYFGWRALGGSTGYKAIDGTLDWWARGAGAGALVTPGPKGRYQPIRGWGGSEGRRRIRDWN